MGNYLIVKLYRYSGAWTFLTGSIKSLRPCEGALLVVDCRSKGLKLKGPWLIVYTAIELEKEVGANYQ